MTERLQKFLASAGIGSRRGCEQLIKDGKVIVNGKVAELGTTVSEKDIVEFDNKIIQVKQSEIKLIALNKPRECSHLLQEKKRFLLFMIIYQI